MFTNPAEEQRRRSHVQLLIDVARMYFIEDMSQFEIAERIGYSRPTVSRLITQAKSKGMVRISIEHPMSRSLELERRIKRNFGLDEVAVAEPARQHSSTQDVAHLTANLVVESGHPNTILAMSWGSSMAAVVDAMPTCYWQYSNVVQMVGAIGLESTRGRDAPQICQRMADRLGGTYRPISAPIVVKSTATADALRHEELILTSLELAARSDIALAGIGAVDTHGHPGALLAPFTTPELENELRARGAVAHVCGHFFDGAGQHIDDSLCRRVISMAPERLANIELSIGVAWGATKVRAMRAALRAGLFSALITDAEAATTLLKYN